MSESEIQARYYYNLFYTNKSVINDSVLPEVCLNHTKNDIYWNLIPEDCSADVYLVWLIKSSIYRNSLRRFIRQSWAQELKYIENDKIYQIRRVFLVGSEPNGLEIPALEWESNKYGDILQGTFVDSFRSVGQKVVLGMRFVKQHCSSTRFVAVADDDAMILPWNMFQYLGPFNQRRFYAGFFKTNLKPVRNKFNRWYVSEEEYKCSDYPPFPSGALYFMSTDVMIEFYDAAKFYYLFLLEDALFGGLAIQLKITPTDLPTEGRFAECPNVLVAHNIQSMSMLIVCHGSDLSNDQTTLWSEFCSAPVSGVSARYYCNLYCKSFLEAKTFN